MIRDSRFFNIRPGELFPLLMASLGTFTSIASVVLGRTLSDAILLSARPVINVANFFIFSSLALMAISLVYFQLLRLVSSKILNISALIIFALGVFIFSNLELTSHPAILSCAIFLVTAPALGNIIVWNAIGDAFNARQGRRIFHLVSAASTLGGIASGILIPELIKWFGIPALPIATGSSFILMAIPVFILHKWRRSEKTQYSISSETRRSLKDDFIYAIKDIVRSPLLKNLSIIFFLTALATNIIDFVLKFYLQTSFDKEGIANFYGYFNAVSNTFNLIVQLTFLSQFLTRFKTRTLFAVTPLILLFFSVPFIFTYSAMFIIALRFMDVALRFTIQDAAREIAISSLPRLLRNRSKVVFKGFMNPLGGICAGLILNIISPLLPPQFIPLLLIPVTLITLYFARDLNRFSAYHLYKQLQNYVQPEVSQPQLPATTDNKKISYDTSLLMDDSPMVRDATIDAILLDSSEDLKTHSDIHRCALAMVAHETRLAQATIVLLDAETHHDAEDSLNSDTESQLQLVYDQAINRMFKGLMALYRRDMIQTIYHSLADARASTRSQAIELLQLTLTNCPYAKRILILCDDFSREEKMFRLDDIEHISVEDAINILDLENDRVISKMIPAITSLVQSTDNPV